MADSNDEEIIELTQMLGEVPEEDEVVDLTEMAQDQALEPAPETVPDSGAPESVQESSAQPDLAGISSEQLEAAIERVIEKKFSQQIEKILFEVTETVIRREIADIKAGLQKDLDDIDNA